MIALSQAFAQFQEIAETIPQDDHPMMSEAWNDYTDSLTKDGELCALQYHYCPAWDDAMPGDGTTYDHLADDRAFILDAMNITISSKRLASRADASDWDKSASHWRVTLKRDNDHMKLDYSMGAAHIGLPELDDVLNAVLRDAEYADESFKDFCASLGYDTDSRKAYRTWLACKRSAAELARMFSASAQADLRELFADY